MIFLILVLFIILLACLIYILYKYRTKPDIYLLPDSHTTSDIYGEKIINLLAQYGNIIKVQWPQGPFDLYTFSSTIAEKINQKGKKVILVGYSVGSLVANIIASEIGSNLKSMYLVVYSCDGNLTPQGQKVIDKISTNQTSENLLNKLYFSETDTVSPYMEKLEKQSALSPTQIQHISTSIGKFVSEQKKFCKLYNVPVYIIYGTDDIVYGKPPPEVCSKYNCTSISGAGHSILSSHMDKVYEWFKTYI